MAIVFIHMNNHSVNYGNCFINDLLLLSVTAMGAIVCIVVQANNLTEYNSHSLRQDLYFEVFQVIGNLVYQLTNLGIEGGNFAI